MEGDPKILVVDDRPANLLAVEGILAPLGHTLVLVRSGAEALAELAKSRFALVLLDVQMPGMDGLQTASLIRNRESSSATPIIFLTATKQTLDHVLGGYSIGAVDYIIKPVDPAVLRSKVAGFVELFLTNEKLREQDRLLHEQRYQRLMETMPLPMWATDRGGVVYFMNRACIELMGDVGPVRSVTFIDASPVHPSDSASMRSAWRESVAEGQPFATEYRLRRARDGAYRWHIVRGVPERDDLGMIDGWIITATDIEEQRSATEERARLLERAQRARADAEAANRSKDELLATISHELRTPLNAILGWAHMLQKGGLSDSARTRALVTIERNARAQARLISDLLDVSRIATGTINLDVRPVDLAEVVRSAIISLEPALVSRNISVQQEFGSLDGPVSIDPGRMQQIVGNLLTNAVKFGATTIVVRLEKTESHVIISVADDGHGISPSFLPHVFDRFQAEPRTRTQGGLGLGLTIVHHLVRLHGGTVTAESDGEGRGATFTIQLPYRKSGQYISADRADDPALDGMRILIVDDEADARDLLVLALGRFGAVARGAASTADALEAVSSFDPEIVVTDIGMPDADGYSLCQSLHQSDAALPIVAVTAYASSAERARALGAGFSYHLPKPVDPTELAAVVSRLRRKEQA